MEMATLPVPIIIAIIGEGASGGALGIGVGDTILMMENCWYSVISPEGCAAILWRTAEQRKHAAEALRLTSRELSKLDLIDEIIAEPVGGAHRHPEKTAANLEKFIVTSLNDLKRPTLETLVRRRHERIRRLGSFFEEPGEKTKKKPTDGDRSTRRSTSRTTRLRSRISDREKVTAQVE